MDKKTHEHLLQMMETNRQIVEQLGGAEEVTKNLDLFKAMLKYKTKEKGLKAFRKAASYDGYYSVSMDMIAIVETYGTLEDKSALCILCYYDMDRDGQRPRLTKKRLKAIEKSIKAVGGYPTYLEYMNIFNSLIFATDMIKQSYSMYYTTAEKAAHFLNTYLWFSSVWKLLVDKIPDMIADEDEEKFKNTLISFFGDVAHNNLNLDFDFDYKPRGNFNGDLDSMTSVLSGAYKQIRDMAEKKLSIVKGILTGINKWIEDNKAEMFAPLVLRKHLVLTPFNTIPREIPERFTKQYAEEHKDELKEQEKDFPIFPEYEDLPVDEEAVEYASFYINRLLNG